MCRRESLIYIRSHSPNNCADGETDPLLVHEVVLETRDTLEVLYIHSPEYDSKDTPEEDGYSQEEVDLTWGFNESTTTRGSTGDTKVESVQESECEGERY